MFTVEIIKYSPSQEIRVAIGKGPSGQYTLVIWLCKRIMLSIKPLISCTLHLPGSSFFSSTPCLWKSLAVGAGLSGRSIPPITIPIHFELHLLALSSPVSRTFSASYSSGSASHARVLHHFIGII